MFKTTFTLRLFLFFSVIAATLVTTASATTIDIKRVAATKNGDWRCHSSALLEYNATETFVHAAIYFTAAGAPSCRRQRATQNKPPQITPHQIALVLPMSYGIPNGYNGLKVHVEVHSKKQPFHLQTLAGEYIFANPVTNGPQTLSATLLTKDSSQTIAADIHITAPFHTIMYLINNISKIQLVIDSEL